MAAEQLNSSTVVYNSDIPQTLEEKLLQSTTVVDKDIPQTLEERLLQSTTVVDKDIAQTIEEKMLQTTIVAGQIGDNQRSYVYENNASSVNLTNDTNIFVDFRGKQRIIVMSNITDSQLAV